MLFTERGGFWSLKESYITISCGDLISGCVDVQNSTLNMHWASAPLEFGYKCTRPPYATVVSPEKSDYHIFVLFKSLQVSNFY